MFWVKIFSMLLLFALNYCIDPPRPPNYLRPDLPPKPTKNFAHLSQISTYLIFFCSVFKNLVAIFDFFFQGHQYQSSWVLNTVFPLKIFEMVKSFQAKRRRLSEPKWDLIWITLSKTK